MRLDQHDSYRTEFDARVAEVEDDWVRLDQSAFYPTSGGQPHDTGTLESSVGTVAVIDVRTRGAKGADAEVWHRLRLDEGGAPSDAPSPGDAVRGRVDWDRRYRNMQRHTAQHLLSRAFLLVGPRFETRSVGIVSPDCTLDLAGDPDGAALDAAERIAADLIYRTLPVDAFEIDADDAARYPLRRAPKVEGRLRLVQIGEVEIAACGGTHLRSSAEAGPIKLLGSSRIRGDLTRVTFRAGWDALDDYRAKHDAAAEIALGFSAHPGEIAARVAGLRDDAARAERRVADLEARFARARAAALAQRSRGAVVERLEPDDAPLLGALGEALAEALAERPDGVALLGVPAPPGARLLFVASAAAAERGVDAGALLQRALPAIGGRGGGRPERAQGAGSDATGLDAALEVARTALLETAANEASDERGDSEGAATD